MVITLPLYHTFKSIMGHDIVLVVGDVVAQTDDVLVDGRTAQTGNVLVDGRVVAYTGITFNWSCFSDTFHINMIHGHRGDEGVIRRLQEALDQLKGMGYEPNVGMAVDSWGNPKVEPVGWNGCEWTATQKLRSDWMEDHATDRYCMFAYHIKNFLYIAKRHPEAYWYSDQVWGVQPLYEYEGVELADDIDSD